MAKPALAIGLAALAAIAVLPAEHVVRPRKDEEMRPALRYLGAHRRAGDALVVSSSAQYALAYYHICGCSSFDPAKVWRFSTTTDEEPVAVISHSPDLVVQSEEATVGAGRLLGRGRVWALFAEGERETLLDYLDRHGKRLQTFRSSGPSEIAATVYLYDLKG